MSSRGMTRTPATSAVACDTALRLASINAVSPPADTLSADAGSERRMSARGPRRVADAFARLRPDLVVVLGDRYELLAVGAAATIFRIPIAHLHGGESTEGAIDEVVRHALTKLSHLHLVATRSHAARVVSMGEERWRIHVVGAPGLDHLTRTRLPPAREVLAAARLPADDGRPLLVVTHHPTTL